MRLPSLAAGSDKKRPNIVFVLADDLGWGDLSCYNSYSMVPMENANRLAMQGIRFTDMHASSAVCTPSRYSILTGRYCWRTELKKGVLWGESTNLIEEGRMTVASMLKAEGYYTAGVGKWHLGLGNGAKTDYTKPLHPGPIDHGFDYYFGIPASLDMPPYLYFENDHVVEQPTSSTVGSELPRGVFFRPGPMAPHFVFDRVVPTITDKAVSILHDRATHREQPFFLYVALPSPHTPWLPLPAYQGKSGAGAYGDYAVETDAMLGRVMQTLQETGLAEDTLLIFTSDNGADWKPGDIDRYGHRANAEWRGEKADIWEAGHRIPFIARWPSHIRPGTVSEELGSLTDFMATTAAITGARLPRNAAEDSFNLLPALLGRKLAKPIRETIVDQSLDGMLTIREGKWKLEEGLGSGGFTAPIRVKAASEGPAGQLYDLESDPREMHNLYRKHPEIVEHLSNLLKMYQRQGYTRTM
jgi:arylsulfatase A-like enzyme